MRSENLINYNFQTVRLEQKQNSLEVEYELMQDQNKQTNPLSKQYFQQFQNAIKLLSQLNQYKNNQYQQPQFMQKYEFQIKESDTKITQTIQQYYIASPEQIKLYKDKVISDLLVQVREFQNHDLHISYFNFRYLGYSTKNNIFCFLILPGLLCVDDGSVRKVNISNEIQYLTRGEILYQGINKKLEILSLLKNYVCFFQNEQYSEIQKKMFNNNNNNQEQMKLKQEQEYLKLRQIMRESIFFANEDIYLKNQTFLQDIEVIIAYQLDCYQQHDYDKSCTNCKKISEKIPGKCFEQNQNQLQMLINYLQNQERVKLNSHKYENINKQRVDQIQTRIDQAVEEYYNKVDNIENNLKHIQGLLDEYKQIYMHFYDEKSYVPVESQHKILMDNLKRFQKEIYQIQQTQQ